MTKNGISAYVVPHSDAHASEYLAPTDERIAFISGFDGSAGTAVVTLDEALLWTDGRYFNQATTQLGKDWKLMKDRVPGVPKVVEWLASKTPNGTNGTSPRSSFQTPSLLTSQYKVGFDPRLVSIAWAKELTDKIGTENINPLAVNLIDQIWASDKPRPSSAPVDVHPLKFAGESIEVKILRLQGELKKQEISMFIVSALDEVAWLFNLRGSDIPYNPVFFGFGIVRGGLGTPAVLFTDVKKLTPAALAQLEQANVILQAYEDFESFVASETKSGKTAFDPESTSYATQQAIVSKKREIASPIQLQKACKNDAEVTGTRSAHLRDGLAKTRWLYWLESMMRGSHPERFDEVTLADELAEFRSQQPLFKGLSFPSISSFGANAAVIHYHAQPGNCARADPSKIYLIDSGAQYEDGTTDVTRTVHFGHPTEREKDAYTRVLKGVIAIASAIFPEGTTGPALDVLGRQFLWQVGMDFRHGIGHGVGAYLCVHEGPQSIGQAFWSGRGSALKTPLKKGMLLSDEPGFYEDGSFGIRIENVMVVVEKDTNEFLTGKKMLGFDTLTLIPIQKRLIKGELLSQTDKDWLNRYHAAVYAAHHEHLSQEEREWLREQCAVIA